MRHFATKNAIGSILGRQVETAEPDPGPVVQRDKTGRRKITRSCHVCMTLPNKRRRKMRKNCQNCQLPVCDEHSITAATCLKCHN